jgi:hypothetical protein
MNITVLNQIIDLLRNNKFFEEADTLDELSSKYCFATIEHKKEIAQKIKSMCHVKWLGDIYINDITIKEWYGLLDKLSKSV